MNCYRLSTQKSATSNRHNHMAIVLVGNHVVGTGYSRPAKNMANGKYITGRHAEVDALRNAVIRLRLKGKHLRRHTIIVMRTNMQNSAPCIHCARAMAAFGTTRVIYSDNGGFTTISTNVACQTTHVSLGVLNSNITCNDDDSDDAPKKPLLRHTVQPHSSLPC